MKKKVFISNNFTKQYGIHIGIFFNLLTKSFVLVSNYPYYFDTQLNWKRPSIACTHYTANPPVGKNTWSTSISGFPLGDTDSV